MTEIQVRPKADKRIAWQYAFSSPLPDWVKNGTKWLDGDLILDRKSGRQIVEFTDWLIKDIDSGISWCTDVDMWKEWEKV